MTNLFIQLNKRTSVVVESGLIRFHNVRTFEDDVIVLRNDKAYDVLNRKERRFLVKRFIVFVVLALLGGLGHYLYDTQFLGYNPNPTIISAIVGGVTLIGLALSFPNRKFFSVLVDDPIDNKPISIPIDKHVDDDELNHLAEILGMIPPVFKRTPSYLTGELSRFLANETQQADRKESYNEAIYGVRTCRRRPFLWKQFLVFVGIALIGGLAHFLYDTLILEYNPNPTIISAIVGGITLIGLAASFPSKRYFIVYMSDVEQDKPLVIPIGHEANADALEQLIEMLALVPVSRTETPLFLGGGASPFIAAQQKKEASEEEEEAPLHGAHITKKRQFSLTWFLLFVVVALLGGLGHYLYDTQILNYNPNPTIISAIVGGVTLIGIPLSFPYKRYLSILTFDQSSYISLAIPVRKQAKQEDLERLIDMVRVLTPTPKASPKPDAKEVAESVDKPTRKPEPEVPSKPVSESNIKPQESTQEVMEDSVEEPQSITVEQQVEKSVVEETVVKESIEIEPETVETHILEAEPDEPSTQEPMLEQTEEEAPEEETLEEEQPLPETTVLEEPKPEQEPVEESATKEQVIEKHVTEQPITTEPPIKQALARDTRPSEPTIDQKEIEKVRRRYEMKKKLADYTVARLRQMCKSQGMKNYTALRKEDLIDFMIEHGVRIRK